MCFCVKNYALSEIKYLYYALRVLVKYKFERVVLSLKFVHFTLISEVNLCISTKSFL